MPNYSDNCYANLVLHQQNKELYIGDKKILQYRPGKNIASETRLTSHILVGAGFIDSKTVSIKDVNYDFLRSFNLMISTRRVDSKNFAGQRSEHYITRRNPYLQECSSTPPKHFIQFDAVNKVFRLVGKNAERRWVNSQPSAKGANMGRKPSMMKPENIYEAANKVLSEYSPFETKQDTLKLNIPEMILGVNERAELVCVPETRDPHIFGITGERRAGKSLLLHRLLDNLRNKWKKKCANLNDVNKETGSYCTTWQENSFFQKRLSMIGEKSMPLPMIYLHPNIKSLNQTMMVLPDEVGFRTSLPFEKAMLDYGNFLKGKKDWEFKNTGVYFRNLMFDENDGKIREPYVRGVDGKKVLNNLVYAKNTTEAKEFVEANLPGKSARPMRMRINGVLADIWNQQIFENSSGIPAYWRVKEVQEEFNYSPWVAALRCDLTPSLVTSHIRKEEYFTQMFKYIAEDIYQTQKNDPYFKNEEVYLSIDEVIGLVKNLAVMRIIDEMTREGGMNRVGLIWGGQYNEDIPQSLKLNTTYYFAFKQIDKSAKSLKKDFSLPDHMVNELKNLNKFECFAMTTNNFVLYNKDGERMETDEPQKITTFPSVSAHTAPRTMVEEAKVEA